MDISTARDLVLSALDRLRVLYHRPVFDEWAIVAMGDKHGGVLAYGGPRPTEFLDRFQSDIAPLRVALAGRDLDLGEFEFANDGVGTRHDAVVKVGPGSYLILNNVAKSMAEVRADPGWLNAQPAFADLAEHFQNDPLESMGAAVLR